MYATIDLWRFSWVGFCFFLSFWRGIPLAAFLTLCADAFLLFTEWYGAGVYCFLWVHSIYERQITGRKLFGQKGWLLLFCSALPLQALGIVYAEVFAHHGFAAVQKEKVQPSFRGKLYLCGLFCFLCCDLLVAWGYFFLPLPVWVWRFYAPSQLLLALTAGESRLKTTA